MRLKAASFRNYAQYFKVLFALGVLVAAIYVYDFGDVVANLKKVNVPCVILALFIGWITLLLTAMKLWVMVGTFYSITFGAVFRAIVTGKIFGYFMPGTVGNDICVIMNMGNHVESKRTIAFLFFIERIVSVLGIVIIVTSMLPWSYSRIPLAARWIWCCILIGGAIIGIGVLVVCLLEPKLHYIGKAKIIVHRFGIQVYGNTSRIWKRIALVLGIGIFMNVTIQVGIFILLRSVHLDVDFFYILAVVPINSIVVMIPLSIMGVGLREGGYYYFLSPFGITMEEIISFNLIGYTFEIVNLVLAVVMIVGIFPYLKIPDKIISLNEKSG